MKATDKEYLDQQQQLLPTGFAWTRELGGFITGLLAGLAIVWARVHNRALAMVEESDPSTSLEMLEDWERNLGLPDACTINSATTLQERRNALVEKLTTKGTPTVTRFQHMAEDLGYTVTIKEHRPFICGISRCGTPGHILNGGHDVRFVWTVTPHGTRVTRFRCGQSAPPEKLCKITRAADLECKLHQGAPSHTLPVVDYQEL